MARYRVGEGGLRVITARGTYSLPPGVVLDEIPDRYEGKLIAIELDGYDAKVIRPGRYEDKGL